MFGARPPGSRPTGIDAARQAKIEVLLGERNPDSMDRAVRFRDLDKALQGRNVVNTLSQIVRENVRRETPAKVTETGSITSNQTLVASYAYADTWVREFTAAADPVVIGSAELTGWNQTTLAVIFTGTADNLHRTNSGGVIALDVNGVEQSRVRFTTDAPIAPSRFAIPLTLTGIFIDHAPTLTVAIRSWTASPDDADQTYGGFYIRGGRLLITGGKN